MIITPQLNDYYTTLMSDIIAGVDNGIAGKRRWVRDNVTGVPCYASTTHSTFPDWCKFFYVKTPKHKRDYFKTNKEHKPFMFGYFNGNTYEFLKILNYVKGGYCNKLTPRQLKVFDTVIVNFLHYMADFESRYGEPYYRENKPVWGDKRG